MQDPPLFSSEGVFFISIVSACVFFGCILPGMIDRQMRHRQRAGLPDTTHLTDLLPLVPETRQVHEVYVQIVDPALRLGRLFVPPVYSLLDQCWAALQRSRSRNSSDLPLTFSAHHQTPPHASYRSS
jgi:hypothetical protein